MLSSHDACVMRVTPVTALVDDVIQIVVTGLPSLHDVTLASTANIGGELFAYGYYTTDRDGIIDLDVAPSTGGTYTGVDAIGLLWSLKSDDNREIKSSLTPDDISLPINVDLYVISGHVTIKNQRQLIKLGVASDKVGVASDSCRLLSRTRIYRHFKSEDVRAVPVTEGTLRGMLFIPAGAGPFPGLIDLNGATSGLTVFRAALLASRGFTTLALAYLNYADRPRTCHIELDYFEEAVDWLYRHQSVLRTSGGIGVVGYCTGGAIALSLASFSKKVKAVVCIGAGSINAIGTMTSSGRPIPVFKTEAETLNTLKVTENGLVLSPDFDPSLDNEFAAISVAHTSHCQFLLLAGEDDKMVDISHSLALVKSFQRHGLTNYRLITYPGAGHCLLPPYMPFFRIASSAVFGLRVRMPWFFGGELGAKGQSADEHSKVLQGQNQCQVQSRSQHQRNKALQGQGQCQDVAQGHGPAQYQGLVATKGSYQGTLTTQDQYQGQVIAQGECQSHVAAQGKYQGQMAAQGRGQGHSHAQEQLWKEMLTFLRDQLNSQNSKL